VGQYTDWDPEIYPLSLGLSMVIISIGALISQPIAGAILDHTGSWLGVQLFCGCSQAVSILFYVDARITHGGWKWVAC
jgi:hypothetical protein